MINLAIRETDYRRIIDHLEALRPEEGCGLVAGQSGVVQAVYPIKNRLTSSVAYEMDPAEQLAAMLDIEVKGWVLIGIYHSHPLGPASPSVIDIERNFYPEALQLIISWTSQDQPLFRAFLIEQYKVTEVPIQII